MPRAKQPAPEPNGEGENPILNNPYEEPRYHYATSLEGELDYTEVIEGRRIFTADPIAIPVRQGRNRSRLEVNEAATEYFTHHVNLLRKEVGAWREAGYPANTVTRVTKELLDFWFRNPERTWEQRLFFAQQEAIETAIWLNEVAPRSNVGQHILARLQGFRGEHMAHGGADSVLPRIAFKMATGTGKTVVMAALILYHFLNRQEYRQDTRFADYFLVATPGVTIRERLGVLRVKPYNAAGEQDYYHARFLVPRQHEAALANLNARLVITNFHAFEPRVLQGNKRSPFDGKRDAEGNKQEAREDPAVVMRRLLGHFRAGSRLLVLNDEAHHCYLPRGKGPAAEGENPEEENKRAAVWFNGLVEVARRYRVETIYDLSATPYYLSGSGFDPYTLFPWVVSDFGLIEAIESGLVKIPFIPESDTTQELTMPVLRNLYEHVREELPRMGQRTRRARRRAGEEAAPPATDGAPVLPALVRSALDQFYRHYAEDYDRVRGLFEHPPVLIIVCNNTSVSKEVYRYVAGYERELPGGEAQAVAGHFPLFSNYDTVTRAPLSPPPTLLIDSDALENSEQISDEFREVLAPEIEAFKREYARTHGRGEADQITDARILREVVNTVGKTGMLGAHVRCVVSVSMLTEGWDANTVTHVMGLRAFGSQLLCEQVAGRALRRKNYYLQGYDKEGKPTRDPRRVAVYKFPPEYAHIIGIPFKTFRSGQTGGGDGHPVEQIFALPDREEAFEITFPQVVGYRVEHHDEAIRADFSEVEPFEIDCARYFPIKTTMANAFSPQKEMLTVDHVLEKREQEVIYAVTAEVIRQLYRDDDGYPEFQRFQQVRRVVQEWYDTRVKVVGAPGADYRKLLLFIDPKRICSHLSRGIFAAQQPTDTILPVLNFHNPMGSTKHVRGQTTRETYETTKSHVNKVVADTDSWEQIAAKTLEELPRVEAYVKNAFLGFAIPYVDAAGEDRLYFTDFIARCRTPSGARINLMIEVTGMNRDKVEKRWYVEHRWLPAVNAVRAQYGMDEWRFVEIANDIRTIKDQLVARIQEQE